MVRITDAAAAIECLQKFHRSDNPIRKLKYLLATVDTMHGLVSKHANVGTLCSVSVD